MRRLIACIFFLFLYTASAPADEATISAKVDKTTLEPDDTLTLTVTISTEGIGSAGEPEIPALDDFEIQNSYQSTNFSFINGRSSLARIFSLVLKPKRTGDLTIPPIKFTLKGKEYTTSLLAVHVGTVGPAPQGPVERLPAGAIIRDPGIEAAVSTYTCTVNEPIIYTVRVYSRSISWAESQFVPPSFKGFLSEELKDSASSRDIAIGDVPYHVEEARYVLVPVASGQYEIEPAKFAYLTNYFFGDRRVLKTQSIKISVLPLPEGGKPPGFSGAVGTFSATTSLDDKKPARVNEPLTFTVAVSGEGNLKPLSALDPPKITDARMYPSKAEETRLSGLRTRKVFEYVMIPEKSGPLTIEPICVSYFDPKKRDYGRSCTRPVALTAAASDKGTAVSEDRGPGMSDIRPIAVALKNSRPLSISGTLFIIFLLAPWAPIVSLPALRLLRSSLKGDRERARRKAAFQGFHRGLRALGRTDRSSGASGAAGDFFSESAQLLTHYLEERFGIRAGGMTHEDLSACLSGRGAGKETVSRLNEFLRRSDAARFSSSGTTDREREETASLLSRLVSNLDALP